MITFMIGILVWVYNVFCIHGPKAILLGWPINGERPPWAAGPPKPLVEGIFYFG